MSPIGYAVRTGDRLLAGQPFRQISLSYRPGNGRHEVGGLECLECCSPQHETGRVDFATELMYVLRVLYSSTSKPTGSTSPAAPSG